MEHSHVPAAALLAAALLAPSVSAQLTQRVCIGPGGIQSNGETGWDSPSISADGRFIAFDSEASNLVAGDTNGWFDIFVFDRATGTTELISVATSGEQGNWYSTAEWISSDGRYVAFASAASNLVPGDTNGVFDIFVRDRQARTTERVSISTSGMQGDGDARTASISADGRYVAFDSGAGNILGGPGAFVRDRRAGTTRRVDLALDGSLPDGWGGDSMISSDGRYVVFDSAASDLVLGDINGTGDVFVRELGSDTTELVSVAPDGTVGNGVSYAPAISADGRFVIFFSVASNLVPGDMGGVLNALVRDRLLGTTERISVDPSGHQGNGGSLFGSISADGRFATFMSAASDLVPGDTNGFNDVFLRDRLLGRTQLVSVSTNGTQANAGSTYTVISADGRHLAFSSVATNLVAGDTNNFTDVFVRDPLAAGFSSVCEPGIGDVVACPCSNPPAGPGRGCDNSSMTGGATLTATGLAAVSRDSLVFTTRGEPASALSIVMQGNAAIPNGVTYGQGVRCVGGSTIRRLFTKHASGGSITAPDSATGDPTVVVRSATKGDVIHAGESRWYLVYYRDPIVLDLCPPTSTFNATQTGKVEWSL